MLNTTQEMTKHKLLFLGPLVEGLNGVNRQPSKGQTNNRQPSKTKYFYRQPSKTKYFYRQPSNERAKISRQISQISLKVLKRSRPIDLKGGKLCC